MTTATLPQHREDMLARLEANRPDEFVMMAMPYLRACPSDEFVRMMVVRSYVTLGLIRPAIETLDEARVDDARSVEYAALRASLVATEPPPLGWESAAGLLRANLDALAARGLDAHVIARAWNQTRHNYERFIDARGQHQVRRRDEHGTWSWFPSLRHHAEADERETLPASLDQRFPLPIAYNGIGLGGLLQRVYDRSHDTFLGYSCALFVVEPNLADFAVALHLRDWSRLLSDTRVQLLLGADWTNTFRRIVEDDVDLPLPVHLLTVGPRDDSADEATVRAEIEAGHRSREAAARHVRAQAEALYENRTVAESARRLNDGLQGTGRPLRILATTSSRTTFLQYSMRDALRALETLHCTCRLLKEQRHFDLLNPIRYHEAMVEFQPDLVFVLDHLRSGFGQILPQNLPLLTWDQDQLPHVFTQANVAQIAPHDFVAGYSKRHCMELGADPSQLLYCDVPTCPEQFGGPELTDEERHRYACDMSYVSHASQTPEAFHEQERRRVTDPGLRRLLDTLFELLPPLIEPYRGPFYALNECVLLEGVRRCGVTQLGDDLRDYLVRWYLWRLGDRVFRHQALTWAADWATHTGRTLRIYGNGWEDHPTLAPFAAGPAHNGRELICIYRASRINLQLMPAGFIHQRALDGLAAGGFFLTRQAPFDLHGRRIRRLVQRMAELGITTTRALLASGDELVDTLLAEIFGPFEPHVRQNWPNLCELLYIIGESIYPDEAFEHFDRIVFDSAAALQQHAAAFVDQDELRAEIVASMRDQVVARFSYQAAMRRMLEGMATHLSAVARKQPSAPSPSSASTGTPSVTAAPGT